MDSVKKENLHDILAEFLDLDDNGRANFLSDAALAPDLRTEVETLSSLQAKANGFMSASAPGLLHDVVGAADDLLGQRIGKFVLVREIGSGGMGVVYLAERSDETFVQNVAIKILRRELNTPYLREAFASELANQAALIHPNIAAIIDAGTTDDGRPFIVMEFVNGRPIDRYCDEHQLTMRQRIKLFIRVCDTVGFAHRSLIVHRDLKPGNILVTDEGTSKLLDFGISELISTNDTEKIRGSIYGLTPNYSSPEQRSGEKIGTPADIYSLGVILFKLLTGKLPPDPSTNRSSNSVAPRSETPATFSSNELHSDIECIVQKATRNDPEERYPTAEALVADLWRFIDGHPVSARRNSIAYRLRKLVVRRKVAVAAGAIIFISLVGGSAAALWQAQNAQGQAVAAKKEQDRAEKISKFMSRVLSYANPSWWAEGAKAKGQARVLDVMLELGEKIDEEFANDPDIAAELHYKFTEAYLSHPGENFRALAQQHITRALELRKRYYGDYHELVAKDMAYVYWAKRDPTPIEIAQFADAIAMLRNTNRANRNLPFMLEDFGNRMMDDSKPEQAEKYYGLAPERSRASRHELADMYFSEMLDLLRLHYAEDDDPVVFSKCALAITKAKTGQLDAAQTYYNICRAKYDSFPADAKRKNWLYRLNIAESLLSQAPSN